MLGFSDLEMILLVINWTHASLTSVFAFHDDLNLLKFFCLLGFADI